VKRFFMIVQRSDCPSTAVPGTRAGLAAFAR
jgi:hypothetical protein